MRHRNGFETIGDKQLNATASGIDWRLTDEEILAWLNEIVSKPTGLRVTFGDIQGAIGLQGLGEIVEAFEDAAQVSAALRPTMTGLSSVGVLLDSPERLGVLQMICPPQYFAAIKALAITEGPRWSIELAMGTRPTLATIAAERAQHESEIHRQKARVAGIRFGDQFQVGGDAGAVMTTIWEEINGGN